MAHRKLIYSTNRNIGTYTGGWMMTRKLIKTYIKGFDDKLGGGIPEGSVVLLVGEPGTMKSSVAFNVLFYNAIEGDVSWTT